LGDAWRLQALPLEVQEESAVWEQAREHKTPPLSQRNPQSRKLSCAFATWQMTRVPSRVLSLGRSPDQAEHTPASAETGLGSGLYVTATPIGNARDVTLRALDVLRACDFIAAEDNRVTSKLISIHGIS